MAWKPVLDRTAFSDYWLLNFVQPSLHVPDFPLPVHQSSAPFDSPLSPLTELEDSDSPLCSSPSPLILSSSTINFSDSIQVIETNFDPSLEMNLTPPYPRDKDFDCYPLTQIDREKVSHAVIASSISDFSEKVC